jgi:hypothetical protein
MTPSENLHRDYGRLTRFLKGISFRLQLRSALDAVLLLASGMIVVLLGALCVDQGRGLFPYLPFFYAAGAIVFLAILFVFVFRRVAAAPPVDAVAKRLEEGFPRLGDDVTNSILLFQEFKGRSDERGMSGSLLSAQIRKTAREVCAIEPRLIVPLKSSLKHLRLLLPLAVAFSAVVALDPASPGRSMALILHPLGAWPVKETKISVRPEGATILRGSRLLIVADVSGTPLDHLALRVWPEGRDARGIEMTARGEGRFSHEMVSVRDPFSYQVYQGGISSAVYRVRVVDPPDVARVRLTLIAPEYAGLPREVRDHGRIEALKGTVVQLEASTTRKVQEARILMNEGNQLPLEIAGDKLTGEFPVLDSGSYSIRLKDDLGFENSDPVRYPIQLIPDRFPEAELIGPAQEFEISGTELIPLVYRASDDFGVASVKLAYQMAGEERVIPLKSGNTTRSVGPDTFRWDVSTLSLTPGERVTYRLEVWDNDSVSGPKAGYSKALTLIMRDDRARASREGQEAQEIADALLDLLADHLEEPSETKALDAAADAILKRVENKMARMENRVERLDYEALRKNLAALKQRMSTASPDAVTQDMERLALLAEDIAKRARMSEVEALAREIRNRQRRLVDRLNDFKAPLGRDALDALMKELKNLQDLVRSMMEAMSKMATRLPEEFANSQDVSGMDFQDFFKDLDEIQKKLMAGDLAGALEAAQRLLQALSEMMAALGKAGMQAGMSPFGRVQEEMGRQAGELDKILAEQKEILGETEGIDREIRRGIEEETGTRLMDFRDSVKESLRALDRLLPPEEKEAIEQLENLLDGERLDRFTGAMKELESQLGSRPEVRGRLEDLRKRAEALLSPEGEPVSPVLRERFPGLSSRQDELKERTARLSEKLEALSQLFPGMDSEILNDIQEATGSMGTSRDRLKEEDAPGAIPPEQDVIRRLSRSQQAMQQMGQQMAMRMQAARWGYQLVYDPRPGWYYGPWAPLPTLPQPELNRPREKGYTGIDTEEFDPPSRDAYKVPKMFREQIMDNLKEGIPAPYRREVEKYFRELTE